MNTITELAKVLAGTLRFVELASEVVESEIS